MSSTPHPVAPEEVMAHLDGELSPARAQSVSTHVESCTDCQTLVASLRNTSRSLSNWSINSVPVGTETNVVLASAKSPAHSGSEGANWSWPANRWTRKQWIGGLAAAVVLLFFISVPRLRRSDFAANQSSAIARERLELKLTEKGKNSIGLNGRHIADQRSNVFSNQIPATSLNSTVTLTEPSVAADSNGLLHGLGDHVQNSFSVDGQPRTDQQSRVFTGPMIARTVSLSLIAKDFESARASLDGILARHNGYAAELSVATPLNAARSLQASLRIPASQLPAVLAELKSLGRVEGETQNGEEVTQQHADLVARLKNSRETEERLQAILTQRTGKISDVLEVEQQIARVRGEIEQMEAEQKNLEHRVDFATINLQFSEEYKAKLEPPAPAISTLIHNAAVNGYRNVADTLLSIVLFFAEYGPVLIFWLLVLALPATLVWRRWRQATAAI
jgi:Domain of unknown function (DUF4349)/Putative zinc-finger